MKDPLDQAKELYAKGKFKESAEILETCLLEHRDVAECYHLLALSCLRLGDSGSALTYLRRAEQLAPNDDDVLAALAATYLARRDHEKALALYLEISERNPSYKLAKRGLEAIRIMTTNTKPLTIEDERRSTDAARTLLPNVAKARVSSFLPRLAIAVGVCLAILVTILIARGPANSRPEIDAETLDIPTVGVLSTGGGQYRYILAKEEVIAAYEAAKSYFKEYRDNMALVEINKISNSNASEAMKAQAESLRRFTIAQDFLTLRDNFEYEKVKLDYRLYEGCTVAWKGVCATLETDASGAKRFDFLIGYDSHIRIDGIVKVRASDRFSIEEGASIELLGVIRFMENDIPYLECLSIKALE
jgi:tetratricopeptide (TPR) repeat protein